MVATACTADTPTVALSQDGAGALNADLLLSGDGSNGAEIHGDGLWVPKGYGAKGLRDTNQAIGDNAAETVKFPLTAANSISGMHSTSLNTDRLVCVKEGWYDVLGTVSFDADPDGYRRLRLLLNGVGAQAIAQRTFTPVGSGGGVTPSADVTAAWYFAVGDYVVLEAFHTAGNSLSVIADGTSPFYTPTLSMFLR